MAQTIRFDGACGIAWENGGCPIVLADRHWIVLEAGACHVKRLGVTNDGRVTRTTVAPGADEEAGDAQYRTWQIPDLADGVYEVYRYQMDGHDHAIYVQVRGGALAALFPSRNIAEGMARDGARRT